jgi:tRNA(Ile)-lysidine synthase
MFYERMVRETGAELLCLGHHRNDQFETTLLRMVTGSDPIALAGMPRERSLAPELKCRILRPLLDVSKEEIRRAAGELSLPVSEDPTNSGDTVLRNRLRNRVIPHMQEAMPDLEARLGATRRRAALLRDLVEGTVEGFPWRRTRTERGECLSAAQTEIFALQPYLRLHVLIDAVNSVSGRRGRRVSDAFLSPFLREDLSSDARLKAAGHDVLVEAADGVLTVAPLSEPSRPEGFLLCGKRSSEDAPRGTAGAAVDEPSDEVFEEAVLGLTVAGHIGRRRIDCSMVSDGFAEPIVLRNRRPGDVLQRDGGTRRVKRVLIDLGVPKEFRDRIPVIEDRRGIVAVLGSVAGCTDALRTGVRHGHASSGHVIFQLKKD